MTNEKLHRSLQLAAFKMNKDLMARRRFRPAKADGSPRKSKPPEFELIHIHSFVRGGMHALELLKLEARERADKQKSP